MQVYVLLVEVRTARREDLTEISRLAHEAWWEAYADLVATDTINRVLEARYAPSRLAERLLKNYCYVASVDGETVGFAEAVPGDDRLALDALYCQPSHRHQGVGRRLMSEIQSLAPTLPMCTDIVLGNLIAESTYESWGFSPGEIFEESWEGEVIVRRRWWLPTDGTTAASVASAEETDG